MSVAVARSPASGHPPEISIPLGTSAPASAEPALVVAAGLSKRFRPSRTLGDLVRGPMAARAPVPALHDVSIRVAAGEFVGLLGPNGAGKTTLLKVLATMIRPDSGTATIAGLDVVRDAGEVRRLIAPVLASERSLYWRLSAAENLELFAALLGVDRRETVERVHEVLEVVGLAEAGTKMVGQFSAGMMQRLLVGRALLGRPSVLLLDEPTRSLDPSAAHAFRAFLREEVGERRRCAVVAATHRAEEAFDLCDRVLVMNRGRVVAEGTAAALAAGLVGDRYSLWTLEPNHVALEELVRAGRVRRLAARSDESKAWWRVDVEVAGGDDAARHVLAALVSGGMPVARFERVAPALADVIDRAIARVSAADVGGAEGRP